jgi:hypothetical protein
MRLRARILSKSPAGWQALLAQIGFPASARGDDAEGSSILIVADDADASMIGAARETLRAGGGVLCSGRIHAAITGSPATERAIGYLVQDDPGGLFPGIGLVDLSVPCSVPAGANAVRSGDGRPSVYAGACAGGWIVALPFDAGALRSDIRAIEKSVWMDRGRLPYERVSRISRGGVRKLVARGVELLHHRQGLPYVHLWQFPGRARSLFAFRVDTDYASHAEVAALAALLERSAVPATWFVHVEGQEAMLPSFAAMREHEIGVHCFTHEAFTESSAIEHDLRKALSLLRLAGIEARSYAGPYGRWSPALAGVQERLGIEYASEFSYAYDDLPSVPATGGALQVPVHPISVGNLRRQGCTEEEMASYFTQAATRLLASADPMFFYHHPKNLHHGALEALFSFARAEGIAPVLLGDYARWWKRRAGAEFHARIEADRLTLAGTGGDIEARVTRSDGMAGFISSDGTSDLAALAWSPAPAVPPLPRGIARTRAFNPWIPINRLEDLLHRALSR